MQYALLLDRTPLLTRLRARLVTAFGPQRDDRRLDPTSQLVSAIISARTRDAVSLAAFARLRRHYRDWAALRCAEPFEIECLIRPVMYADVKARWLPRALDLIAARTGALDLDFLATRPVDQAMGWLRALPGCDVRNAATTINFSSLRMRALSIDTHLLRIGQRLGLLPETADYGRAYHGLMRLVPESWDGDDLYELHWLMKQHGQQVCTFAAPKCGQCVLRDLCPQRIGTATQAGRARTARPARIAP